MKKSIKNILPFIIMVSVFVGFLIFDLISKQVVENNIELGSKKMIIKGFISFFTVHNFGAAWSIFSGKQIFLIIFTIIFLLLMIFYYIKEKSKSYIFNISYGFILAGTFGNLIDRIFLGYVRDFINLEFMEFPVFNIADICLTVGVGLFMLYIIILAFKEKSGEKK